MGLQIRDDRQMKALTGLSQAQFDHLLSVFSDIYRTTQQQTGYPFKPGQFHDFRDLAQQRVFVAEVETRHRCGRRRFQKGPETLV